MDPKEPRSVLTYEHEVMVISHINDKKFTIRKIHNEKTKVVPFFLLKWKNGEISFCRVSCYSVLKSVPRGNIEKETTQPRISI